MAGGRYSQVVRALRIGLPLLALALLSTVFLVGQDRSLGTPSDFLDGLAEGDLLPGGILGARFNGQTADGTTFQIRASAVEDETGEGLVHRISDLSALLDAGTGAEVRVTAPSGRLTGETNTLDLAGPVLFEHADGTRLEAARGAFDLSSGAGLLDGGVRASGPFGTLTAERMRVVPVAEGEDGGQKTVVRFEERVRATLTP